MGACFITHTFDGTLTEKQVREKFQELQRQEAYEHGHSYSGTLAEARGLLFEKHAVFDSYRAAEDWLIDRCQKWEEARVVRARFDAASPERWFIAAWCAE